MASKINHALGKGKRVGKPSVRLVTADNAAEPEVTFHRGARADDTGFVPPSRAGGPEATLHRGARADDNGSVPPSRAGGPEATLHRGARADDNGSVPPSRAGSCAGSHPPRRTGARAGSRSRSRLRQGSVTIEDEDKSEDQQPRPVCGRKHARVAIISGGSATKLWVMNVPNAEYFTPVGRGEYRCIFCPFSKPLKAKRLQRHLDSSSHMLAVREHKRSVKDAKEEPGPSAAGPSRTPHLCPEDIREPLSQLLDEIRSAPLNHWDGPWIEPETGMAAGIDWEAASMDTHMQPLLDAHTMSEMAEKARQYLLSPEGLDDESDSGVDERSGSESEDSGFGHLPAGGHHTQGRSQRKVTDDSNLPFFPWPDRETCVLDILRHIPRSAFSRSQNETIHWAMSALGLSNLPSDRVMDDIDRALQDVCGIESLRYKGALGHIYYTNDLAGLLAQEMANPDVRKHLRFYPEDTGDHLSEAWQAKRWKDELDPSLITPMICTHGQDFYTDEICLLRNGACMPRRWFQRGGHMFARAWRAHPAVNGWIIDTSQEYEIAAVDLVLACSRLITMYHHHQLPDPKVIIGAKDSTGGVTAWSRPVENEWRLRSNGHRVLALPLWLYCDDTSGNQSKKWNKHNSFLFTLADSRVDSFIMLDGIVEQLKTCQKKGIWAWDCVENERVLLIPSILAMLGDNPMQSEFACHIGLRGRKFCRMCHVEGDVEGAEGEGGAGVGNAEHDSDASSVASDVSNTAEQGPAKNSKRSTKKSETMAEMVQRVTNFMKIGPLRRKSETRSVLRSQFIDARWVGGNAAFKRSKTLHGIKDTFQAFFLNQLFDISTKRGRSKQEKEKAMRGVARSFPAEITSPVWRIKDFDPHSDTPVEILHVILLGFVKYFWRDAIHRLKDKQRKTLISRLSSFDTSGLGVSPLSGSTLVTYAGSLTGRDFRVIAQVAPFVLYDLLEKDLLNCWNAIGILVPIVWQPQIEDVEKHIELMKSAIDLFLDCVCRVTPRWFNKPKFHIILHLSAHVQRFGPAMLFVTEGFKSFNAIIRSASVHSNRHAPSRDIAHRMAKGNRVRHLLSGGKFLMNRMTVDKSRGRKAGTPQNLTTWMEHIKNPSSLKWHAVGPEPLKLLQINHFGERILGLGRNDECEPAIGLCSRRGSPVEWSKTEAAKEGFLVHLAPSSLVYTPANTVIANGDLCHPSSWVIYSSAQGTSRSSFLVIAPAISTEKHDHYWMPRLQLHAAGECECVAAKDIKCTVNVQHNCIQHSCTLTNSRVVFQEREATENFYLGVRHLTPNDLVLNTAQMCDAKHIRPFRPPFSPLNRELIVLQATKLEIDERKKKKAKQVALDAAASSTGASGAPSGPSTSGGASRLQRVLTEKPPQRTPGFSRSSAAPQRPYALPMATGIAQNANSAFAYAHTHPPPPLSHVQPTPGYVQSLPTQQYPSTMPTGTGHISSSTFRNHYGYPLAAPSSMPTQTQTPSTMYSMTPQSSSMMPPEAAHFGQFQAYQYPYPPPP
ncbi:hypothetical protein B0H34DRAFT_801520 [Crassisporium funariophilum]|nr:hypothetical protein B0H34DRAFT_801520 [Crassisporium funariophilum]